MKLNLIIFFSVFLLLQNVKAQDCAPLFKQIQKDAITIKEKTDTINLLTTENQKNISLLDDSIKKLALKLKNESSKLQNCLQDSPKETKLKERNAQLETSVATLTTQVKELQEREKKFVALTLFEVKRDSLETVKSYLKGLQDQVAKLNTDIKTLNDDKLNLNKYIKNGADMIIRKYQTNFETLVKSSSKTEVESDLNILAALFGEDDVIKKKMLDIITYKDAEALLNTKYDKTKIEAAKQKLHTVKDAATAQQLIGILDDYEDLQIALKNTITEIQVADKNKAGGIDAAINQKQNLIAGKIESYIYYYNVDLAKYVYLNSVINKLKNLKMDKKTIDADVSVILRDL